MSYLVSCNLLTNEIFYFHLQRISDLKATVLECNLENAVLIISVTAQMFRFFKKRQKNELTSRNKPFCSRTKRTTYAFILDYCYITMKACAVLCQIFVQLIMCVVKKHYVLFIKLEKIPGMTVVSNEHGSLIIVLIMALEPRVIVWILEEKLIRAQHY